MKFHGASIRREATGLTRVFAEHEAIAKAIADGQEDDARRLMFEHLQESRGRLFQASQK